MVRSFLNDCTQRLLDGTLDDEAAYMAKWWCTEQQGKVTDECLQLFGGYGYMAEYPDRAFVCGFSGAAYLRRNDRNNERSHCTQVA